MRPASEEAQSDDAGYEPLCERVSPETARRVLSRSLRNGGEFAEIFVEERISQAISSDDGKIDRATSGSQLGAGIRVLGLDQCGFAFTESLDEAALFAAAEIAGSLLKVGGSTSVLQFEMRNTSRPSGRQPAEILQDRPKLERAQLVERGDRAARATDPRIRQVTVFLGTIQQQVLIANSEGKYATDVRSRLRYRVQAVAKFRRRVGIGTSAPGVTCGFEYLSSDTPEQIAKRAADQAVVQLDAAPPPAGQLPVVLGNGAGGVLIHEACGHALEADSILNGGSFLTGRLGHKIASNSVNVVDDGGLDRAWGRSLLDDEGCSTERTVLVENGILTAVLTDRASSLSLNAPRTGNGRRASFRHLPIPRMTNTYVEAGDIAPQEIIEATQFGLYAPSLSAGQVNPASGSFLFTAREAYIIRKGQVVDPVWGATIAGEASQVLNNIDLVGDDLDVVAGNCSRDGQRVFVGVGQPTLRIKQMTVGGKAGGRGRKDVK